MDATDELTQTPPADTPPPATDPPPPQTEEQEEAALDQLIEEKGVEIPGDVGGKLVPLEAVTSLKAKLKAVKGKLAEAGTSVERATQLEGEVRRLQEQLGITEPLAQAYRAAVESQQAAPRDAGHTAEERAELESIARDYDFYKTDGNLDLERAGRHQARVRKEAEAIAKQHVAPIQEQTVKSQSAMMMAKAMVTKAPQTGQQPDPGILADVWGRVDPSVTATLQGAQWAWKAALAESLVQGKAITGQTTTPAKAELPPPLLTEKAGGRDVAGPTLNESDKQMARQLGISDKEYAESLSGMPSGWGKR